jgi:hypothetical protein
LGLIHYSEKEFFGVISKSLKGEVGGISKELAEKFLSFLDGYSPDKRNFSALVKEFSFTNGLGTLLVSDVKVQNLVEGATKEEVEKSTLTIKQALAAIKEGKTPYKAKPAKK